MLGRGLDEQSEIILWVRGVATALIAGVVARIVLIPPGALAACRCRCGSRRSAVGFLAFLLIRRSAFAGVVVGEAVLVAGALAFGVLAHDARPTDPPPHVAFQVFLDGIVAAVRSVFFYVLVGNYVGIGALAHEVGFSFWWMALSHAADLGGAGPGRS